LKSVVIGIGNTLFKDDGIGVYTALYLKHNYTFSPELDIVDGGTLGLNLLEYLQNYDRVIILDTLSIHDQPGTLYKVPAEEFKGLGSFRSTAHEVEVIQMLEAGELYGLTSNVIIIGIIPEDIESVSIGLSQSLQNRFYDYLQLLLDEINAWGIESRQTKTMSLEAVIQDLMGHEN
jgi:hydrogenase maturation protease